MKRRQKVPTQAVPKPFNELTDKAGKTLPGFCKQFLHYLTSSAAAITPTAYAASETGTA